jgi:polar amino acid transport system permease protein
MFDVGFALSFLPEMLAGLRITVIATLGGFALALVVGLGLELLRRSRSRALRRIAQAWISFIRCTPLLVQLYFVFYVAPKWGLRIDALSTGILCLGIHIGAYVAEVFRAGIDSVPPGQWDAGRALGLGPFALWRAVILPQALPPVIPPLGNYLIGLFKETPLLAAITVLDVFGAANNIAGRTFRYNEPYTVAAVMLLGVSLIAAWGVRTVERRVTLHQRHS